MSKGMDSLWSKLGVVQSLMFRVKLMTHTSGFSHIAIREGSSLISHLGLRTGPSRRPTYGLKCVLKKHTEPIVKAFCNRHIRTASARYKVWRDEIEVLVLHRPAEP